VAIRDYSPHASLKLKKCQFLETQINVSWSLNSTS